MQLFLHLSLLDFLASLWSVSPQVSTQSRPSSMKEIRVGAAEFSAISPCKAEGVGLFERGRGLG